jgi:excisionase family DNA binding protein
MNKQLQQHNRLQVETLSVTIPQAAALLGCTVRAIREAIWAGRIASTKLGKRFVISVEELRAFLRREAGRAA